MACTGLIAELRQTFMVGCSPISWCWHSWRLEPSQLCRLCWPTSQDQASAGNNYDSHLSLYGFNSNPRSGVRSEKGRPISLPRAAVVIIRQHMCCFQQIEVLYMITGKTYQHEEHNHVFFKVTSTQGMPSTDATNLMPITTVHKAKVQWKTILMIYTYSRGHCDINWKAQDCWSTHL